MLKFGRGENLEHKVRTLEAESRIPIIKRLPNNKDGHDGEMVIQKHGAYSKLFVKVDKQWLGVNLVSTIAEAESRATTSGTSGGGGGPGMYDSGWFSARDSSDTSLSFNNESRTKGQYSINHNLNSSLVTCEIFCRFEAFKDGSIETYTTNLSSHMSHSGSNMNKYGYWINLIDSNNLDLHIHPDGISILYSDLFDDGANQVALLGSTDSSDNAAIEIRLVISALEGKRGKVLGQENVNVRERVNEYSDGKRIITGNKIVGDQGAIKEGTKNDILYLGDSDTILLNNASGILNITDSSGAAIDVNIGGGALYDAGTGKVVAGVTPTELATTNTSPTLASDFSSATIIVEEDSGTLWFLNDDNTKIWKLDTNLFHGLSFTVSSFTQVFSGSTSGSTFLIGLNSSAWLATDACSFTATYTNKPVGMTAEVDISGTNSWASPLAMTPVEGPETNSSSRFINYPDDSGDVITMTLTAKNSLGGTIGTLVDTYTFINAIRYGNSAESIGNQTTGTIEALAELALNNEDITTTFSNVPGSNYMVIAYPDRISDTIAQVQGNFGEGYITCSFNLTPTNKTPTVQSSIADVDNSLNAREDFACITSRTTIANGSNDFLATTSTTVQNYVFWGVTTEDTGFDATDVLGTAGEADHHVQTGTNVTSFEFTLTATAGEYIIFAVPNRSPYSSDPTFTVGGFDGGFNDATANIAVTTEGGYTENYKLYRSDNVNLGATTVTVAF